MTDTSAIEIMLQPGIMFEIRSNAAANRQVELRAVVDTNQYVFLWYHKRRGPQYEILSLDDLQELWEAGRLHPAEGFRPEPVQGDDSAQEPERVSIIDRIRKLITEYKRKIEDSDKVMENARQWSDKDAAAKTRWEWNSRKIAYMNIAAELESLVDLAGPEADRNKAASAQEPERVKALRDAAAAVCPYCEAGKRPDLHKNFFVQWWHDAFHPCPASPIHDLIAQEIAAALTKTFIPESDNTGPFMALQMLAEEARIIYEILAQDGLPRGKYYTFLETIEKAEKYTIKRWKRDDPGFAERHVAEGMQRAKGEAGGVQELIEQEIGGAAAKD